MIIDKAYLNNIFSNESGNNQILNGLLSKYSDSSGFLDLELLIEEIIQLRRQKNPDILSLTDKNSPVK